MPIGGWAGTISETHDDTYLVRWSKETLASVHPVYKSRCENDGLDYERYSIGVKDLEPDLGSPLEIRPTPTNHDQATFAQGTWEYMNSNDEDDGSC